VVCAVRENVTNGDEVMTDIVAAAGLVVVIFCVFRFIFGVIPNWRIARRTCNRCGKKFGRTISGAATPYYERLYGAGTAMLDGPRRYMGARVVRCGHCQAEYVFSEMGALVEPFVAEDRH
jgi:hypothetical protein